MAASSQSSALRLCGFGSKSRLPHNDLPMGSQKDDNAKGPHRHGSLMGDLKKPQASGAKVWPIGVTLLADLLRAVGTLNSMRHGGLRGVENSRYDLLPSDERTRRISRSDVGIPRLLGRENLSQ